MHAVDRPRDVGLPQSLITAQREGRLVIFAGAGVSMGPPANLRSFETLANRREVPSGRHREPCHMLCVYL